MKLLHRMVLKMLPGPFLACMGTLMFLLLMQFLIRYLPDLVGKGLPVTVIVELIVYNLAYMVVLAVPMSILIATTMACGQLAESNAYTVVKNAGISFPRLIWPVWGVGLLLMTGMFYFNNVVLPEANYRAKNLWIDVRQKQPGFELEPGMFYTGLEGYSLRAEQIHEDNTLEKVVIFEKENRSNETVITAERGRLQSKAQGQLLELTLLDGELHRMRTISSPQSVEQYEQLRFDRHKLRFDISGLSFDRRSSGTTARSDRTMPTTHMMELVDSLQALRTDRSEKLRSAITDAVQISPPDSSRSDRYPSADSTVTRRTAETAVAAAGLSPEQRHRIYQGALQDARQFRSTLDASRNTMNWYGQQINRYLVEIHKKFSIAVACVIFVLIGAPLGLMIQRGSISVAGGLSAGIFLFYWVTLVQGEKFADRGYLDPWIGMWAANIVAGVVGIGLCFVLIRDRGAPVVFQHLYHTLRNFLQRL